MSLKPDFWAPCARIGLSASFSALAIMLLAACSTRAAPPGVREEAADQSALAAAPRAPAQNAAPANASPASVNDGADPTPAKPLPASAATSPATPPASAAEASSPASAEMVARQLAYADRVRTLSGAELNQEITRLGNPATPAGQLQLALALSQLHQTQDLVRAQELLTRVINSSAPEAQPLQPLARLLAARYGEQRRLEDQLERQIQQTRDVQRRLDQTHERLEALKAIERSLTSRPPATGASAPSGRRNRPAAP